MIVYWKYLEVSPLIDKDPLWSRVHRRAKLSCSTPGLCSNPKLLNNQIFTQHLSSLCTPFAFFGLVCPGPHRVLMPTAALLLFLIVLPLDGLGMWEVFDSKMGKRVAAILWLHDVSKNWKKIIETKTNPTKPKTAWVSSHLRSIKLFSSQPILELNVVDYNKNCDAAGTSFWWLDTFVSCWSARKHCGPWCESHPHTFFLPAILDHPRPQWSNGVVSLLKIDFSWALSLCSRAEIFTHHQLIQRQLHSGGLDFSNRVEFSHLPAINASKAAEILKPGEDINLTAIETPS